MTYLQPVFPFVLLLAPVQAIRYRRSFASPAFRGLALALAAVFLASWAPAAWLLSRCFERRYPPREYPTGDAQAIVLLASAVYPPCPPVSAPRAGSDTYERCQYAAWLFKHWKPLLCIVRRTPSLCGRLCRIVMVTDAYHMLRADACFRKQSFTVIPAACGYRTYHNFQLSDLLPGWEPIAWNEAAVHESIGLVWYRLHGWI